MPTYTIEATIRASARFTLQLEADDEAAARAWARALLDPVGLNVDGAFWETPLDTDEGSVTIEKIEGATEEPPSPPRDRREQATGPYWDVWVGDTILGNEEVVDGLAVLFRFNGEDGFPRSEMWERILALPSGWHEIAIASESSPGVWSAPRWFYVE